jgi:hypothetical protein
MASLDTSSPQLHLVEKMINAFISLDTKDLEHILSKNYRHQSFPSSPEMPDEPKGEYIRRWAACLSLMKKLDVGGISHRGNRLQARRLISTTRSFITMWLKPRGRLSSSSVPLHNCHFAPNNNKCPRRSSQPHSVPATGANSPTILS